mgnify:CR=1 FL=1
MPRGKSLNLYLMDGSVNGRVKMHAGKLDRPCL